MTGAESLREALIREHTETAARVVHELDAGAAPLVIQIAPLQVVRSLVELRYEAVTSILRQGSVSPLTWDQHSDAVGKDTRVTVLWVGGRCWDSFIVHKDHSILLVWTLPSNLPKTLMCDEPY